MASIHAHVDGFNIFAGALLGVCAGLLWTAQGTIMISYPNEGQKGKYFGWFWGIFNMGAVIGGLVSDPFIVLPFLDSDPNYSLTPPCALFLITQFLIFGISII